MSLTFPITGLTFTAFSSTPSNVNFTLAWPDGQTFTSNSIDLFAARTLGISNAWSPIFRYDLSDILPVANTFSDTIPETSLPPLPFFDPEWIHSVIVTNVVPLPPDGTETATNMVTVSTGPKPPSATAFLLAADLYDGDGDGLTDAYERHVSGTNPGLFSTAGDGTSDGWKIRYGLNPLASVIPNEDSDGDGLNNLEESACGTDPHHPDTDRDGLNDKLEIQIGTNPTSGDTDGDHLTDEDEYRIYMTNPIRYDTDQDGLSDGWEITRGTSPFDNDSDNDDLGDFREADELNSDPLSRDTDGDGIDDRTEYDARNTVGLDLLDSSDATDDYDEDGFSNVYEHMWGWSFITRTNAYETARFRIMFTTAGQDTYRRSTASDSTGSRLVALGNHPTFAAKIRIPTSTETQRTNIAKRLYFTSTPGIRLNGTSLDALSSPIILPDSDGNKTYTVTALPSAAGQVAQISLGDDTGKTNSYILRMTVPQITMVDVIVSQNPDSAARTNIVPGVTGVICANALDERFGTPRVTLHPTLNNDSMGDGQLIWQTDFLLARASGATNGTWTVNWMRWNSAYESRHGIPVPLGRTRIDVGIDFDFNGELSDEEVGASCDVCVIEGAVVPDYDRSKSIDLADEAKARTNAPVFFWINDDRDSGNFGDGDSAIPNQTQNPNDADTVVNGRDDLVDFFPVWLDMGRILNVIPANAGFTYKLRFSKLNAVWTSLTRAEAGKFLTEDTAGCGPQLDQNAYQAVTTNLTGSGILIPEAVINAIRSDPAKGVVFLEGSGIGNGDLCLDVCLGSKRCWTASVPIRLTTVENMYNHLNLRPDGEGRSTYTNLPPYCPCPGSTTNLVFLHGFHVTAQEARGWHAKMFKKLHQSGSNARFCGVTWQGNDGVGEGGLNYQGNVVHAFETAPDLKNYVNGLSGTKIVMAHSLGNMVVSSAIADHGMNVSKYFMLNAAVPAEAYDSSLWSTTVSGNNMVHRDWTNYLPRTWSALYHQLFDPNIVFGNDDRHTLTWKNRFAACLPSLYNYYSSGDEIFEQFTGTPLPTDGLSWNLGVPIVTGTERYCWQKQELYKGRDGMGEWAGLFGTDFAGWGFELVSEMGEAPHPVYTAAEANAFSETDLADPLCVSFRRRPASLFSPSISAVDRYTLLAKAIPALSGAAGNTPISTITENEGQMDMNVDFHPSGWPRTGGEYGTRWLHNDMKDVAYFYTAPLFDAVVQKGQLK